MPLTDKEVTIKELKKALKTVEQFYRQYVGENWEVSIVVKRVIK